MERLDLMEPPEPRDPKVPKVPEAKTVVLVLKDPKEKMVTMVVLVPTGPLVPLGLLDLMESLVKQVLRGIKGKLVLVEVRDPMEVKALPDPLVLTDQMEKMGTMELMVKRVLKDIPVSRVTRVRMEKTVPQAPQARKAQLDIQVPTDLKVPKDLQLKGSLAKQALRVLVVTLVLLARVFMDFLELLAPVVLLELLGLHILDNLPKVQLVQRVMEIKVPPVIQEMAILTLRNALKCMLTLAITSMHWSEPLLHLWEPDLLRILRLLAPLAQRRLVVADNVFREDG